METILKSYGYHTVLTCHPTGENLTHLNPSQTRQHTIYVLGRNWDERLSWPEWLVVY